ncbi:hypothetical protein Poli38472_011181 [Pythium oligandrum]|uniref:Uncharacterized protein n=1 Tax=Pythium oligandrum TaxID=41045 RepID=A0A8K1FLV7_PYTOL|nr:hypothetical protein Poli38472_011181 [Pythium oligandrum]|eukprot:TMW67561.1 hypothetical protein Poli38472_011181 [Pythium oligandrum]
MANATGAAYPEPLANAPAPANVPVLVLFATTMGLAERFDLEKQLVFYMSYHYDKINMWIHFTCIWPILITAFMMVAETKPFFDQPEFIANLPLGDYIVFNFTAFAALVYMVWYMVLDIRAGSLGAFLVFWVYIFANYFAQNSPRLFGVSAWVIALPIHVAAWVAQFIGHGVFERRKPALLDSLDQALITAPLFVLLEALFSFGYRPELYRRVMVEAEINVKLFRAAKTLGLEETTPLVASAH